MPEIIPAIIPKSYDDLVSKLSALKSAAPLIQIDFCDGKFAPSKSWPFSDDSHFSEIVREEKPFPFFESVDFEAHLMIENPENHISNFVSLGAERIIVHLESTNNLSSFIGDFKARYLDAKNSFLGVELSIAAKFETPIEKLGAFADKVSSFQLMSIKNIGFQGQNFAEEMLQKISALRTKYPKHSISVDGGINLENAKKIAEAGANRLVVGSAIIENDNPVEAVKRFVELFEGGD